MGLVMFVVFYQQTATFDEKSAIFKSDAEYDTELSDI